MKMFQTCLLKTEKELNAWQDARRKVVSETTLILTAGFSLIMIAKFYFGDRTFLPLAETLDMRPTVVWAFLSALISIA